MKEYEIELYRRLAKGIAKQFGSNCEVVVHDLESQDKEHPIVVIENGHVSGRKLGDGPSHIVLEALKHEGERPLDKLSYLTKTHDGKILKSSTIFINNEEGRTTGIFSINYDISLLMAAQETLRSFTLTEAGEGEVEEISSNVSELLEELIEKSISLIGKPTSIMTKEERIRAISYLNKSGAFLITKAGAKVCSTFGISKYTLYSYLDEIKAAEAEEN